MTGPAAILWPVPGPASRSGPVPARCGASMGVTTLVRRACARGYTPTHSRTHARTHTHTQYGPCNGRTRGGVGQVCSLERRVRVELDAVADVRTAGSGVAVTVRPAVRMVRARARTPARLG